MYDILVVEDNDALRGVLKEALSTQGYSVSEAQSAEEGFEKLNAASFDLVITDLKLPEADGIEVLKAARRENPSCEVIVATAYGTVDKAVEAMKQGAADFITKPFSIDQIRLQAAKILRSKKIKEENAYLRSLSKRQITGASGIIATVLERARKIAASDAAVLITGESGTGKELIAEEIHRLSERRESPVIKVNCAALAPGVLESELFGHEKGAFTDAFSAKKGRFELADKGTIFLDEIADLPLELQVKLLRVLQEKEFERVGGEKTIKIDVRVIAATNKNLKAMTAEGKFRQDLYYRLNVVEINMPALRERREDIPALIENFIIKYAEHSNYSVKGITKEALDIMTAYPYPGNIRELENIIQRMLVMAEGEMLDAHDVPYDVRASGSNPVAGEGLNARMDEYEKKLLEQALKETGGNKLKAAELLKINRATFMARVKKYGL
ncbi:MAG: sigma-54 dependent transcriptional regulator [Spirochaetia bacterium]|nr:sigma-54 dependent transcriptional regulator [Spirochaetia bacterium]